MLSCQLPCHLLIDKFAHVWALIFIYLFDNGTNFMFEPMFCGSSILKNLIWILTFEKKSEVFQVQV